MKEYLWMQDVLVDLSKFAMQRGLLNSHAALELALFRVQNEFEDRLDETKELTQLVGNVSQRPFPPTRG